MSMAMKAITVGCVVYNFPTNLYKHSPEKCNLINSVSVI